MRLQELYCPTENVESRFEVKGSEFISYLVAEEFLNFVAKMRKTHPKAVHFVTAHRFLNDQKQLQESFSDDGEPKGTSGMPTLKVMRGYGLIECGILVVRYFGGTLLGTGGLVRAYTQSAKDVILKSKEQGKLAPFMLKEKRQITIDFSSLSQLEYLAQKSKIAIVQKIFLNDGIRLVLQAECECLEEFLSQASAVIRIHKD